MSKVHKSAVLFAALLDGFVPMITLMCAGVPHFSKVCLRLLLCYQRPFCKRLKEI